MSCLRPQICAPLIAIALLLSSCDESIAPAPQQAAGPTADQELAALLKKANAGDPVAQDALARRYSKGEGVPKDAAKAVEWFARAAAQGNANAQRGLGWMYQQGQGVPKNAIKAVEWYVKAANQGNARAQLNLGFSYETGEGVPKDAARAADWYEKAANQGNAVAQVNLGNLYWLGEGVPKNLAKAVEWFAKAAEQGDAKAQFNLGNAYKTGLGVPKDDAKAMEFYKKAAAQGSVDALFELAIRYEVGIGVPKDAVKAAEAYQKAASLGDSPSQYFIGSAYQVGDGVPRDLVFAYAWLNLSASGSDYANRELSAREVEWSRERFMSARDKLARELSADELAEAQRLSSNWKKGEIFVREGSAAGASAPTEKGGALTKASTGTMFIIGTAGYAITNKHVVEGCTELRIASRDGIARSVTEDAINDLALVKIPGEIQATATLAPNPGKLRQGDEIVVYGFPLDSLLSSEGNLTPGVVSALTGIGNNTNQIQITAPIQPGSSGSPVLNQKGEVVGVVSSKLSDAAMAKETGQIGQNVNFAVSGQTLKTFLDAHNIEYATGGFFSFGKSTADIAEEARKWTMVVECWK